MQENQSLLCQIISIKSLTINQIIDKNEADWYARESIIALWCMLCNKG